MPKEPLKRSGGHEPSAKLGNRQFATHENAVKHVEIGEAIEVPGEEILQRLSREETRSALSRKEKHQLKRDALLQRLGFNQLPPSKSHGRRLKRKAKEQLAGGFNDIQAAITALDSNMPQEDPGATQSVMGGGDGRRKRTPAVMGKIGEGRNATLSDAQRKRALRNNFDIL